jgi:glycosyltransferase involved in cell wall biosynthesis
MRYNGTGAGRAPIDRKRRILLVITRLTVGGDTNVVLDIAEHFNRHPHFEAHLAVGPVAAGEIDLTRRAHERNIKTLVVPSLVNRIRPASNLAAALALHRIIRRGQYDIVHTHSSVAGIVGRIAAFAAGVPVIVHHIHGWGLRPDMSAPVRQLYLASERLCARLSDRLIAVSQPTIRKGLAHHICGREKFVLIHNGLAVDRFRQRVDEARKRRELGLHPRWKLVGMIGRLDDQKNPLDFIRAAARVVHEYPSVHFLLAGDGALRPACEHLIQELALEDRVRLLGHRNDIAEIVPILTLTALSSLWEGLPVVFQEAMSAGKPIVATDVDGASDVIVNGETGYLVPTGQPDEMASRILSLLNDENACRAMGALAQERSEAFSAELMLGRLESLYGELLTASGRPLACS